MNKVKILFEDAVAETLMITLACRAVEANQKKPVLQDQKALELVEKVDYDLEKYKHLNNNVISVCSRAAKIDQYCIDFLQKYPDGTIISIGSGLDTRYWRIDNGRMKFIDLDLPEVIKIRQQLIPAGDRNSYLSCSAWDFQWLEQLKDIRTKPTLVLSEGVMIYQTEDKVIELWQKIRNYFTHDDNVLVFDICNQYQLKHSRNHPAIKKTRSSFKWGTDHPQKIQEKIKGIELEDINYYARPLMWRLGWFNFKRLWPPIGKGYSVLRFKFMPR